MQSFDPPQASPPTALVQSAQPSTSRESLSVVRLAANDRHGLEREISDLALLAKSREKVAPERASTILRDLTPEGARALFIGENHLSHDTRTLLANNLPALWERGFSTLGIELPTDLQNAFTSYNKGLLTREQLREILTESQKTFSTETTEAFISLVERAHSLGMRVIPIDPGNNSLPDGSAAAQERERVFSGAASPEEAARYFSSRVHERSRRMGEEVLRELSENPLSKVVVLVGAAHLSMEGHKTLNPPKYPPVTLPLLNHGADTELKTKNIPTSSLVVAQRVELPNHLKTYSEPTLVGQALAVSKGEFSVVHKREAARGGDVHAIVTLPAQSKK